MAPRTLTVPRKAPRQARSEATVLAILTATARVLVESGYDRASTNRIAERAGVSVGSLYQYFPSKEALVAALIDRHINEMIGTLEANLDALRDTPIPVATRALVGMMLAAHRVNPKLHKVLAEQVPRVGRMNRLQDVEVRVGARIRAYLEAHEAELCVEDLDLTVFILVHTVEALTHASVIDLLPGAGRRSDGPDDDALADEITAMILRYVMKRPPS